MKLYEILYVSSLTANTPVTAIPEMISRARRYNQANELTGLLVFDGACFAHLLEGARGAVFDLIERIRLDTRHTDVDILHHAELAQRRFNRFSMGYVPVEQVDALGMLSAKDGQEALQHFLGLVPVLDLDQ